MKKYLVIFSIISGVLYADKAYVLGSGSQSGNPFIYVLNTDKTLLTKVIDGFPAKCEGLNTLTFSPNGRTAYVADSSGNVYIIDVESDTYIRNLQGTSGSITDIAFSPDGEKAYISNLTNISIVDVSAHTVTGVVSTGDFPPFNSPYGVAFSRDGSFAYVTDSGSNQVYVIDAAKDKVMATVTGASPSFNCPTWIKFSPDGTYAYVSNQGGEAQGVYRIETSAHTVSTKLTEANGILSIKAPQSVTFSPNGTIAYIPDSGSSQTVFIADTATNNVLATISNDFGIYAPTQIGLAYNGLDGYVTNDESLYIVEINKKNVIGMLSVASGIEAINHPHAIVFKPKPLPPSEVIGMRIVTPYWVNIHIANNISWKASTSAVSEYRIYQNGALISCVSGTTLQYEDYNPKADNYSITSVDSNGVEGPAVNITAL